MIYYVKNIKRIYTSIYLIFLKEILSVDIQIDNSLLCFLWIQRLKHTPEVLNQIRGFATHNDVCALRP